MCNFTINKKLPALFKKQQINLPTGLGWLVVILIFLAVLCLPILKIHSFLALSKPVNSKIFIVEGWMPDYCLEQIYKIYKDQSPIVKNGNQHPETTIFVTGGPLEQGTYLKEFKTFAALGSATLKKLGIPDSLIIEIPAPYVQKDRTYTSALAFKEWLTSNNKQYTSINIITLGIHARRSSILFKKALGKRSNVGVISIVDRDYNPDKWFTSSCGSKMVITELISYLYTKATFYTQ